MLGISSLEHQLFTLPLQAQNNRTVPGRGREVKRKLADPPTSITETMERTKVRSLDQEELSQYLSELEQASYRSVTKLGNKARLAELKSVVVFKKAATESQAFQPLTP
eukprot:scaffold328046_cov690-Tisochrysis_lutea.AAC.1